MKLKEIFLLNIFKNIDFLLNNYIYKSFIISNYNL